MKKIALCILSLALFAGNVTAQENIEPINTGAANFLTLAPDARSAAMGGASIALPGGNNAIFHNAAASMFNFQQGGISYSFAPLMRDIEAGYALNSIAGFYKINSRSALLAGFRYYHYPKIEGLTDTNNNPFDLRPKEWAIDLGYALEVIPNLSVSTTLRLIHSDMGNLGGAKSANALALDIAAIYRKNFQFMNGAEWSAGLEVSNIGSDMKYLSTSESESLPETVKMGGAINLSFTSIHRVIATADLTYRISPTDVQSVGVSAGAEYIFMERFKARGGYHYGDEHKGDASYTTVGAGVCCKSVQLDFAWLFANKEVPLRNSFWITAGYSF